MLAPKYNISNKTANALTAIERARGFLEAANLSSDWIIQMQNKALVLEAYHTTHIEGTQLTLEQSKQLWEGKKPAGVDPDDVKELLNYRKAFDLVSGYLGAGDPITEGLIREIHKRLVQRVRGNSAAPGEYRKIQNYVINSQTKEVVYTPPAVYLVPQMMQDLVDWINQENQVHPVLIAGIAQFQLVHIHPFLDGNGRVARLLSTLCLYQRNYDFKKLFTISEYYDRNRTDYYQAIQSVREHDMDMTVWLEYFSEGLATQLNEIKEVGKAVITQDIFAKKYELSERQKLAVDYIQHNGSLTMKTFANLCPNVTKRTLQRELRILIEKNILTTSGATSNLIYRLTSHP